MQDLRSKTVNAIGWVLGSQVIHQIIALGIGIFLARLLGPESFGLLAMVVVLYGFAALLSNSGFSQALIQRSDLREKHCSSVFWVNLSLGCVAGIGLYLSSSWISVFYERAELENIVKVLSICLPLAAMEAVPRALFAKKLQFKHLKLIEMAAMITSGIIAIAFAFNGFGYWSLVIQRLTYQGLSTLLIFTVSHWQPRFIISINALSEIFSFSSSVFATSVLRYCASNLDKLLIGKFLGSIALGLYEKAQSLMFLTVRSVSGMLGGVMFSSLSQIQSDKERVRDIYLRTVRAIALVTYPVLVGLFIVADSFILTIFGIGWIDIIPILQIFCIAGLFISAVSITGSLFLSQGRAGLQLRTSLITIPIRISGIVIGLQWGLAGVAIGFTVSLMIASIITMKIAFRLVDLKLFSLVQHLLSTLAVAIVMGGVIWVIQLLSGLEPGLMLLLIQIVIGAGVYWALLTTFKLEAYTDVCRILRKE